MELPFFAASVLYTTLAPLVVVVCMVRDLATFSYAVKQHKSTSLKTLHATDT